MVKLEVYRGDALTVGQLKQALASIPDDVVVGQSSSTWALRRNWQNPMKTVTVVTLYDGKMADHFVGVIAGEVDQAGKEVLCKAYEDDDNWEGRQLFFATVEVAEAPLDLKALINIDGEYPTVTCRKTEA